MDPYRGRVLADSGSFKEYVMQMSIVNCLQTAETMMYESSQYDAVKSQSGCYIVVRLRFVNELAIVATILSPIFHSKYHRITAS